jgi:hypothetical protein
MTSHPPADTSPAPDKVGALEELLSAEREISDLLAEADAEAERILAAVQDQIARRQAASRNRLVQELAALESSLRAATADEGRTLIDATHTMSEKFDHVTDDEVALLADFVLQRLYDVTPGPAERTP